MKTVYFERFYLLLFIVAVCASCRKDLPPVYDFRPFLKQETGVKLNSSDDKKISRRSIMQLMEGDSSEKKFTFHEKYLLSYDFRTGILDTVFKSDIKLLEAYCYRKDSLYVISLDNFLRLYTADTCYAWNIQENLPLEKFGQDYRVSESLYDVPFIVKDSVFSITIYPTKTKSFEHMDSFWDAPQVVFFTIDGDRLLLLKHIGILPRHLKDNYANRNVDYAYCSKTDDIFISNQFSEEVSIVRLSDDSPERKKRVGSRFFKPLPDVSYADYMDLSKYIDYLKSNTIFGQFQYDPYRDVYLRTIKIPAEQNEHAMTKNQDKIWVIIVLDDQLNVKYEVQFPQELYPRAYFDITREGVYIFRAPENEGGLHEAHLFIFD